MPSSRDPHGDDYLIQRPKSDFISSPSRPDRRWLYLGGILVAFFCGCIATYFVGLELFDRRLKTSIVVFEDRLTEVLSSRAGAISHSISPVDVPRVDRSAIQFGEKSSHTPFASSEATESGVYIVIVDSSLDHGGQWGVVRAFVGRNKRPENSFDNLRSTFSYDQRDYTNLASGTMWFPVSRGETWSLTCQGNPIAPPVKMLFVKNFVSR